MKALYEITDANGVHLCYQVGTSEEDAVYAARVFYGHRSAHFAKFVSAS